MTGRQQCRRPVGVKYENSELVEETIVVIVVFIINICEIILSTALASEGFSVAELLKVIQTAGNTLVAVAVESLEVDGCPAVHAGINFGAIQNVHSVRINDSGRRVRIGVDEIAVFVSLIIRSVLIAVAKGSLQG